MVSQHVRYTYLMTDPTIPNRCVCGYPLDVRPCPYHGVSTPMTAPLPVTPNMRIAESAS